MRRLGVLVLVAGMVLSGFAKATKKPDAPATTQLVTVAQLEQALAADHGMADKKLAVQIADMKLTERLSDAETARLQATLPGRKSQMALLAVADESAFLDPPAAEIPALPVPDHATQEALINKAMDYVLKQIPTLPDFFATRVTARFLGTPQVISTDLHEAIFPEFRGSGNQRLIDIGSTSANVRYSRGLDVFIDPKKGVKTECHTRGAISGSEFGEILPRVAYEATQGNVVWSHWEQGPTGPLAVFHYEAKLMYKYPRHCPNEIKLPPTLTDFYGYITVDTADGSILRLTEWTRANVDAFGSGPQIFRNLTMVEYGAVEIGELVYLCPVKSVFIVFGPPFFGTRIELDRFDKIYNLSADPVREELNDIVFTDYHLFRAKVRILTGAAP